MLVNPCDFVAEMRGQIVPFELECRGQQCILDRPGFKRQDDRTRLCIVGKVARQFLDARTSGSLRPAVLHSIIRSVAARDKPKEKT